MRILSLVIAVELMFLARVCPARVVVVGTQPESSYRDTEFSTNVVFNVSRNDTKKFEVRLELSGTISNCVQVAFGQDEDGNGDLAPEETDLILGWRRGRYFVEDVEGQMRHFTLSSDQVGDARFLQLTVTTDVNFAPKTAAFMSESGACFADLGVPSYLFCSRWNLAKVSRRGADATFEQCRISNDYRKFVIRIK